MSSSSSVFNNSPTVVLPQRQQQQQQQQQPDQYFHESHYAPAHNPSAPFATPSTTSGHFKTPSLPQTPSEGAVAGRKRSRGDINSPEDDHLDGSLAHSEAPQLEHSNRGEPVYGPGMTLIYPNDLTGSYNQDAGSQSGNWVEQQQENAAAQAGRPIIATRKTQRLDTSARSPDDLAPSIAQPIARASGTEPLIDEATKLLGVSWTRLDVGENNLIKKNAFTRWIARHYPFLQNVDMWFDNSAIPGYLGKVTNQNNGLEEFYLWSFDLHEAILVTRNPVDLVLKLSQPHMSLSQACEKIKADLEPVVEAAAANAAILHNDRFLYPSEVTAAGSMDLD